MDTVQDYLTLILAIGAVLSGIFAFFRLVRPRYRRTRGEVTAIRDSILGRPAITDSITGREIEPALPGVGMRLASQETHLSELTKAVASLAKSHAILDDHGRSIRDHEKRLDDLEAASVERIVSRAESAAGWRAMEAAANAKPDEEVDIG